MLYTIRPNAWALITTLGIYYLTLGLLLTLNLSFSFKCILCLQILIVLGYNVKWSWKWSGLGRRERAEEISALGQQADQQWVLVYHSDNFTEHCDVQLVWHLILMPRWIVLHFKQENADHKIILWPGSLSRAEFRLLRVRLQHHY